MSRITYWTGRSVSVLSATLGTLLIGGTLQAQNLGLEGETGVFVTPLAYTLPSPENNLGKPSIVYPFLYSGSVIVTFTKSSVSEGAFSRLVFGYTLYVHTTAHYS